MSLLPDPPLDPDGELIAEAVIVVYTARGGCGRCVQCGEATWQWWDLSLTGLPPVTDRTGTPTDQVPLHTRCVSDLRVRWRKMLDPADPDAGDVADDAPAPGVPDVGVLPEPPPVRRRPTGAYARRGAA